MKNAPDLRDKLRASSIPKLVAVGEHDLWPTRLHREFAEAIEASFAVYGTGMIPGLVALSALTRLLQSMIHGHAARLHGLLSAVEGHLSGRALNFVQHAGNGKAMAGYIAGAVVIGLSTIYSFVGHKKVTFRQKPGTVEPA